MNDEKVTRPKPFAQEFLAEGAKSPVLGPAYFDARAVVQRLMEKFEAEQFESFIQSFVDQFYSNLNDAVQEHLISDAEMNVQGEIWRMVDASVKALLGGEAWALERYALGDHYDDANIRETIAKHIPAELQDRRLADLQAENKRLREDNSRLRERY